MNWPGLLKWSLSKSTEEKNADTTTAPMTESEKKWLRDALEETHVDIVKEMKELIRYVQELKNDDTEYEAKVVGAFEEALDMIQGVEAANTFTRAGGLEMLFKIVRGTDNEEIRYSGVFLITDMVRNNPFVQEQLLKSHPFELINWILNPNITAKIEKILIKYICSILKGVHLKIKRLFIDIEGINFLLGRLSTPSTAKNRLRLPILQVIHDFLIYDKYLGSQAEVILTEQDKIIAGKPSSLLNITEKGPKPKEQTQIEEDVNINAQYLNITKRTMLEIDGVGTIIGVIDDKTSKQNEITKSIEILKHLIIYAKITNVQLNLENIRNSLYKVRERVLENVEDKELTEELITTINTTLTLTC